MKGGITVVGLVNPKSRGLKETEVDLESLSEREAAVLLSSNPKIMYRPLLAGQRSLAVGFNPEEMEKIIEEETGAD